MQSEPKTIIQKYCPVVGRNVAVEIAADSSSRSGCCLNSHDCEKNRGGCTNKLFDNN